MYPQSELKKLSSNELADLHNELLRMNAHIRVLTRWGRNTMYSSYVPIEDVGHIIEREIYSGVQYRVLAGVQSVNPDSWVGYTHLQFFDIETKTWCQMGLTSQQRASLGEYITNKKIAITRLLEIDKELYQRIRSQQLQFK